MEYNMEGSECIVSSQLVVIGDVDHEINHFKLASTINRKNSKMQIS
jgi:hypothetical protein